jgi:hypothetical protein
MFQIHQADRCRCLRCSSPLRRRGYVVEDGTGTRQFICLGHLAELLNGCCQPGMGGAVSYDTAAPLPVARAS